MFTGDDMLEAWTPDGRPAGVQPSRVVQALGLSTTPPAPTNTIGSLSDIAPNANGPTVQYGGPAPGGVAPAAAPLPSPAPAPVAGTAPASSPTENAVSPVGAGEPPVSKPAPTPKQAAPQDRKPMTTADLRAQGVAGGYNAQADATEAQAQAASQTADAIADSEIKQAVALDERNEKINAAIAKRAADAQARLKAVDDKAAALGAAREKWANTKIDRSIDHPIVAAISVALGALGSALSGKKDGSNPALDMLFKSIDRKVAAQMQDLDKAGQALNMRKEEIAEMRTQASDALALHNLGISAESEKAARQVEAIMARSNSEITKRKGAELVAGIRARGADALASAIDRQTGVDERETDRKQRALEHKQNLGVQYSRIGEDRRQFNETMKFNREKLAADENAAMAAARSTGNAAAQKELAELEKSNRETGINDIASGKPVLQPEGQKMIDEAAKYEAEASKLREGNAFNPMAQARAKMLDDKAAQMRGEATLRHTWRARDTAEAKEVSKLITDTQSALEQIDDIKALYKKHGKAWIGTSEGEKAMRSKTAILALTIKDAYQLGALDKGSAEYLDKITGGDPSKIDSNVITGMLGNSAAPDGALDALAQSAESRANNRAKTAGYRGPLRFTRKVEPTKTAEDTSTEAILQGKTSAEAVADTEAGVVRKAAELVPGVGTLMGASRKGARAAAEADGSTKYFGFSKSQEPGVDMLVRGHAAGNKAADAKLLSLVTSDRPEIRTAALRTIKDHAPDLYQQALAKLPAAERGMQSDIDAARSRITQQMRR